MIGSADEAGFKKIEKYLRDSNFVHWYDQLPTNEDSINISDLAIPAFLGATPNFKQMLEGIYEKGLEKTLKRATECLQQIPKNVYLWDWEESEDKQCNLLEALYGSVLGGNIKSIPGYGPAKATKLLHKKRPMLIPIIDSNVIYAWTGEKSNRWKLEEMVDITIQMKQWLAKRTGQLNDLQKIAQQIGEHWSTLSKLRLYDIIAYQHYRN